MKLKNLTPHLLFAHIDWLDDSGGQPHITLKNSAESIFPPAFSNEPSVKFNISSVAVTEFVLDEDGISFAARFSGKEFHVFAPLNCILSISSKDNTVNIPVNKQEQVVQTVQEPLPEVIQEKVELSIIQGDNMGNGVPSGKLTLVTT